MVVNFWNFCNNEGSIGTTRSSSIKLCLENSRMTVLLVCLLCLNLEIETKTSWLSTTIRDAKKKISLHNHSFYSIFFVHNTWDTFSWLCYCCSLVFLMKNSKMYHFRLLVKICLSFSHCFLTIENHFWPDVSPQWSMAPHYLHCYDY